MKLFTNSELSNLSENELSILFRKISQGLVQTNRETPERRNALASLENINRARNGLNFPSP